MYADKEAHFDIAKALINKALTHSTYFYAEDRNRLTKPAVGEVIHAQLRAQNAAKAKEIEAELVGLITTFLDRMAEARIVTLSQLNQQHARELRRVVKKLAGLLDFTWNRKFFTSAVLNGPVPQGIPFCFGKEPCPEFLVVTFQSELIDGPSGRRTAIIYAIETMQQVCDVILSVLIGSGPTSSGPPPHKPQ